MTFTTIKLAGNRVVVRGTDKFGTNGEQVLDATEWVEINERDEVSQAEAAFNQAVEQFFGPLTSAIDTYNKDRVVPQDPAQYIVLSEPTEGQPASPGQVLRLDQASVILRLIEDGDSDRLVWVGGKLEVLEFVPMAGGPVTLDEAVAVAQDVLGATEVEGNEG